MMKIVKADKISDRHIALEIEAPEIAATAAPGQLVLARFGETGRSTPFPIADFDAAKGTVTIVALTTPASAWASELPSENASVSPEGHEPSEAPIGPTNGSSPAETIEPSNGKPPATPTTVSSVASETTDAPGTIETVDTPATIELTGPFGNVQSSRHAARVLCAAEGVGVGAMLPWVRDLKANGAYTAVILGFPTKESVFWTRRLNDFADELYVITEDGTFGVKGPIRHTIRAVCDHMSEVDLAVALGPLPFLKSTCRVTARLEIHTQVNLAAIIEANANGMSATSADSVAAFDWHAVGTRNGHQIDYDTLMEQFGIHATK